MIIAIWIVTLLIVGLWTLTSWGLASLLAIDGAWVEQIEPWLARVPFGGWLEGWVPDWLTVARALLDTAQALLGWLGGAAPVLVWVLWGAVTLLLLALAGVLTLVVVLIRRNMPPQTPPSTPPPPPQDGVAHA